MKNIIVKSRQEIERLLFYKEPNTFIISITDPNSKSADIKQEIEKNILRLSFYDIDQEIKTSDGKIFKPISDYQVELIVNFIRKNYDDIIDLYVSCEAGISRSAGIAGAIAKYYKDNDIYYFKNYIPNRYCYNKLLQKFME